MNPLFEKQCDHNDLDTLIRKMNQRSDTYQRFICSVCKREVLKPWSNNNVVEDINPVRRLPESNPHFAKTEPRKYCNHDDFRQLTRYPIQYQVPDGYVMYTCNICRNKVFKEINQLYNPQLEDKFKFRWN